MRSKSSTDSEVELDADREAALQFGDQVGRLRQVERAAGDEQDVVGLDHAVLGRHGRAFDQRQQVALHALARHVGAVRLAAAAILSISSRNTMPFCSTFAMRLRLQLLLVEELAGFLVGEQLHGLAIFSLRSLLRPPPRFWNMPWICEVRSSMPGGAMISMPARPAPTSISISLVVEFALAQLLAKFLAGRVVAILRCRGSAPRKPARRRQQHVEHALLGGVLGAMRAPSSSPARASASWPISARSRMMVSTSRPT
jgi:hypothetical protein